MQPTYWARAHVWNRVFSCDVFIWLDHVKFSRSSTKWEDRTLVEGRDGREVVLRLPLQGSRTVPWMDARIHEGWTRQARTIEGCYRRAPHWPMIAQLSHEVYDEAARTIDQVCWRTFDAVRQVLHPKALVLRSSDLDIHSRKGDLVLDLVTAVGGSSYLCGAPGAEYLSAEAFAERGVNIEVQRWTAPVTAGGHSNPSILHLIAHHGPAGARHAVKAHGREVACSSST